MSYQEERLQEIADAIREVKGTTEKIPATNFASEILDIGSIVLPSSSEKFNGLVDGSINSIEEKDLKGITTIRDDAFKGLTSITSVAIPSNVQTIGANAFSGCIGITSLTLAEGVQTIGANAFSGIKVTSLTIPSSVTFIGEGAFENSSLIDITISGKTPATIGANALPDSITSIYVEYGAYDDYVSSWSAYANKIVRLPAKPSTITVTVNNYLGEMVSSASVTIEGNGQTYTGTTDSVGVFMQGDLQPATYTISVADLDGFKTPETQEVVVLEDTQNSATFTYLEKPAIVLSRVFEENTPEAISMVSAEISANNMTSAQVAETYGWNIGDTTDITLTTGEVIQMRIIDFNHDDLSDGSGKAGITLEMVGLLNKSYQLNNSSNASSYVETVFYTTTIPQIKATLPIEWQNIVKLVDKAVSNNTYLKSMDLFLSSEYEIMGSSSASNKIEGTQYEYWKGKTATERIKQNSSMSMWWLRSQASSNRPAIVNFQGNVVTSQYTNYTTSGGVSFAFCV